MNEFQARYYIDNKQFQGSLDWKILLKIAINYY